MKLRDIADELVIRTRGSDWPPVGRWSVSKSAAGRAPDADCLTPGTAATCTARQPGVRGPLKSDDESESDAF
jgi:hypothetical protein